METPISSETPVPYPLRGNSNVFFRYKRHQYLVIYVLGHNPASSNRLQILDDPDYSLVKALQTAQQNFVITDASLPDNPIVFASNGFLEVI